MNSDWTRRHHRLIVLRSKSKKTPLTRKNLIARPLCLARVLSTCLVRPISPDATDGEASNESYTLAETTESSEEEPSYNKADFYEEDDESAVMMSSDGQRAASISPMYLSDEMKYFAKYESSCNYDQGFSWGDDSHHALGYYQFDHRYGLRDFLLACYAYDSATYSMFGQFASVSSADFRDENAIRKNGEFTDLGNKLNAAWHAARKRRESFRVCGASGWLGGRCHHLPAEDHLASRGIDISNRADCVKGLCWGMSNLFGTGGWRKFVGGWTNGYDWNGVWQSSYNWPGCGLNNSMTDREFVTTLCNYVVDNVAVFYKAQPQYHAGWQNRYRTNSKIVCPCSKRTVGSGLAPSGNMPKRAFMSPTIGGASGVLGIGSVLAEMPLVPRLPRSTACGITLMTLAPW